MCTSAIGKVFGLGGGGSSGGSSQAQSPTIRVVDKKPTTVNGAPLAGAYLLGAVPAPGTTYKDVPNPAYKPPPKTTTSGTPTKTTQAAQDAVTSELDGISFSMNGFESLFSKTKRGRSFEAGATTDVNTLGVKLGQ